VKQGKRVGPLHGTGYLFPHEFAPAEYGQHPHDQQWYGRTPNGYLCNLSAHEVIENTDGTITVTPSISIRTGPNEIVWHGYLKDGVWCEV
jgi:hypothetical protein